MAALAGVDETPFLLTRDADGLAAAAPVDTVIVAPALLTLSRCQQAFVVGHELAHLARRHYDEDASAALAYSGRSTAWTANGDRAVGLTNGDFGLAWQLSALWRSQEHEADGSAACSPRRPAAACWKTRRPPSSPATPAGWPRATPATAGGSPICMCSRRRYGRSQREHSDERGPPAYSRMMSYCSCG